MSIKEALCDNRNAVGPFPASTAVAVGDLLWFDSAAGVFKTASARPDLGSLVLNQRDFADLFAGVMVDQRLAAETSTGNDSRRTIVADGIFDADCPSLTWEFGDYVAVDRSATPLNYNQQVNKVSNPALAIGICVKREPSAVTKVRCRLVSKWVLAEPFMRRRGIGGFQGTASTAMADAATVLTVASNPVQTMVPTAARNVDLPAEAQSAGLVFYIVNNSGGANSITVRNPAAGTVKVVAQNGRGIFWCDGTTWFGITAV